MFKFFKCLFGHDESKITINDVDYKRCCKCRRVWALEFITLQDQKGFWGWREVTHKGLKAHIEHYLKDAKL